MVEYMLSTFSKSQFDEIQLANYCDNQVKKETCRQVFMVVN